ncbi:MAG: anthranilate synthase component family protein [Bacteroidetes bacterium]|jgi:para-aminobenzoate synthetase component 1|nr:anthranilate synthase component family protein [Bacteroidota bacterium]
MSVFSSKSSFPANFLIRPTGPQKFKVCELISKERAKNSGKKQFCIITYSNPAKNKPTPGFYDVGAEENCDSCSFSTIENPPLVLKAGTTRHEYIQKINFLKEQIQKGNIYEINYCVNFFSGEQEIDPLSVYLKLNEFTKAPYSSMVKLGDDFIISGSPELFLKKEGQLLSTKPIKGTARRGKDKEEDLHLKEQLYNSVKERTENVMAVDVARNDLSRLAKRGTVEVNKLYNIETYETVHHMVSTVKCELRDEITFDEIIDATFPMASMTGAPKIKAMQLIDESETFNRNFYSGAMGVIEENGDFELSVNIRSVFYNQKTKQLSIAVGSAITHLCEPEKEYDECLLKANALLRALNAGVE